MSVYIRTVILYTGFLHFLSLSPEELDAVERLNGTINTCRRVSRAFFPLEKRTPIFGAVTKSLIS